MKSALGISGARSSSPSYENSIPVPPNPKPWKKNNTETTWSKLDDYDIPMGGPKASESQENLRNTQSRDRTNSIQVMHTTDVTVSRENHSGSGLSSPITPWVKKL